MKIALMSDSHDRWEKLEKAVSQANQSGCTYLLFAGDLMSPGGLKILSKFKGEVKVVLGNNEGEIAGLMLNSQLLPNVEYQKLGAHDINRGAVFEDEINGLRFFMNHYPKFSEIAAHSKQYDVCIYGHNHRYSETRTEKTLLLNPGSVGGVNAPATFMIFDTNDRSVEKITL